MEDKMPKEKTKQTLDERFITEIDGNKFIQLAGLIDLGHKRGLSKIEVDIVQLPSSDNENFAVCKCVVVSKDQEVQALEKTVDFFELIEQIHD